MKLFEYMAKQAFRDAGIPVPAARVVRDPDAAEEAARELGPVVLKVQILAGGRGKAGGIKFAQTPEEAGRAARELLGMNIKGFIVDTLLVEEMLDIQQELYLGMAVDAAAGLPLIIASTKGGVNIEEVPEKYMVRRRVELPWGMLPYVARGVAARLDLDPSAEKQVVDILTRLYQVFKSHDAELTEINPLVITPNGVIAADGRLNVDDDALFRHRDLPSTEETSRLESKVQELGLSYVELDGDIAIMANGAGITMATMDILARYGGKAMNFLDAGGGAGEDPMSQALELLISTEPAAVLVNIFGGITRCDDVARAILTVMERPGGINVPLVVRLVGTNEDEGVRLLKEAGIEAYSALEEAAAKAVALSRGEA